MTNARIVRHRAALCQGHRRFDRPVGPSAGHARAVPVGATKENMSLVHLSNVLKNLFRVYVPTSIGRFCLLFVVRVPSPCRRFLSLFLDPFLFHDFLAEVGCVCARPSMARKQEKGGEKRPHKMRQCSLFFLSFFML
ncbi:hypothetical protein [Pandoravirus japonicus]|uniref:Uncharacterized protein n=1 Tax=Pandoravirus japonicus TaxID=2823154 RepID=A0A811BLN8_9VIRU|nr:hypothetical protein [Pandoravirus japonicus]